MQTDSSHGKHLALRLAARLPRLRPLRFWRVKSIRITITLGVALVPLLAQAAEGKSRINSANVGLYHVNLVCPAAPLIGCGSAAKPLLLQLERSANIDEAWLNRAGTVVAIVWKANARKSRSEIVGKVLNEVKAVEIKGERRKELVGQFLSGAGWYRGTDVDRLSEEEATVISARLVRRIGKVIPLSDERSKQLKADITPIITRKLTRAEPPTRDQLKEQIFQACNRHLNQEEISLLTRAREQGAFDNLCE